MMNFYDSVSITARSTQAIDPDTGLPTTRDVDLAVDAPCAFAVLSAAQHSETWGDAVPTDTRTVSASLVMPRNGPELDADASKWNVTVSGYPGTWRVVTARPGRDWITYLITQ